MKTFLNVLYRRILYKIPLKLLLVLLAVFGILFACFSNAQNVCNEYNYIGQTYFTANSSYHQDFGNGQDTLCIVPMDSDCTISFDGGQNYISISRRGLICIGKDDIVNQTVIFTVSQNYGRFFYNSDCSYLFMDSLSCQTEYNLIPISSVDQNYCTTNNLCPSGGTPSDCPNVGVSNVFINDLFHPGAFNIIMNIPDEIDWDYAYTNSGQNMNIDVVGYNVDYEKIDSIVQFQNYKPTGEDFQKIIGLFAPYTKIIVFFVFLFIVWAWIKKPFKSKKL